MKGMGSLGLGFAPNLLIPKNIQISSSSSSFSITTAAARPSLRRCTTKKDDVKTVNELNTNSSTSFFEMISPPPPLLAGVGAGGHTLLKLNLLTFIASTASISFISFVIAAVPTLRAMRRTAISLSKLVDTATREIPPTMAAISLSTLEITDLTLQFTHLSQAVADGVSKSAQAVQAAEAGVRQLGNQTMSMIEERASLPNISIQPMVVGAAKKTSHAVGKATKTLFNIISTSRGEDGNPIDMIES